VIRVGAASGPWVSDPGLFGVFAGKAVAAYVSEQAMKYVAGCGFVAIGA
jgi:putative Ca2+/H+ antiporter (TMEM165/GDT1 family)